MRARAIWWQHFVHPANRFWATVAEIILDLVEIVLATQRWIYDMIHCARTKDATNGATANNWIHHIIIFKILTVNWTIIAQHLIQCCWRTTRMKTLNYLGSIASVPASALRAARIVQIFQVSDNRNTFFSLIQPSKVWGSGHSEQIHKVCGINSIVFNMSVYLFLLLVADKRIKKKISNRPAFTAAAIGAA